MGAWSLPFVPKPFVPQGRSLRNGLAGSDEGGVGSAGRSVRIGSVEPGLQVSWAADASVLKVFREGYEGDGVNGEVDEERKEDSSGVAGEEEPHSFHEPGVLSLVDGVRLQHVTEPTREGVGFLHGDRGVPFWAAAVVSGPLAWALGVQQSGNERRRRSRGWVNHGRSDRSRQEVVKQRGASRRPGLKLCGIESRKRIEGPPWGHGVERRGPAARRGQHPRRGGRGLRIR